MAEEKYKILKVTSTRHYLIPMVDDRRTKINGWTIEQVIEDWFIRHGMDRCHASRDGHRMGNSKRFIDASVLDNSEDMIFFSSKIELPQIELPKIDEKKER